jgi:aspartyl-tRNA(Asn)/glutamyl-tRNA(Gln) amidotransferase subunit A
VSGDLLALSAAETARRVQAGELPAAEVFDFWRGRAEADESGSYLWVADEAGDETCSGPLGGVPVAVKDLFCVEGVPSSAGSRILEGFRPPYTATAVTRLREAGAPVLGKTNQDEFAMGSSTENSGFGPVRNPWDPERVPGGSSGGSAAAVAAGTAPWSIGTDTGGSIRQPASLCGIVGLKPTYGAVSRHGMIAFASSLDQCGPFGRTVEDVALLASALVGRDPMDSTSLEHPEGIALPSAERLDGLRLGVWGLDEEGLDRGWPSRCAMRSGSPRSWGQAPRRSRFRTPRTRSRPITSSPPPRRARTSPATTACATGSAPRRTSCSTCTS